ncbi:exosortase H-associated membrane protein [Paracidovorax sp. MALMAid1276]|uniref:exosortase H-associated membrane protein n=1 Tax=Paracidovorax sp. MALMAid1276 TaxID=3411631 RepID=UPI003B9C21BC
MRLRRPSALTLFVLSAFGWIVALTFAWSQVSAWTSYPVGVLASAALEQGAPMWVREVHLRPGAMEVDTAIAVPVAQAGGQRGEITIEASPARYAYGLPIFLALLLAARGKGRLARAAAGYLLLLPFQALSLTMYSLMQMLLAAQLDLRLLRIAQWQMEAIVYGYQVGALVLPTLVPIVLWLWLDRRFVNDVLVRGWRESLGAKPMAQ